MTKTSLTAYQIKDLRDDVDGLKFDVKKIMENHLPHIESAMTKLSSKVDANKNEARLLSVLNLGAIILALVIQKVFL